MARLTSPPDKYGTFDNICVYQMRGEDFLRKASSLTGDGERVKKEAAFKKTMALAKQLAVASKLAAAVYAMLAPSRKRFSLYRQLTGQAIRLLKEGHTEGAVVVELMIAIRLPKRNRRKKAPVRAIKPAAPVVFITPAPLRNSNTGHKRRSPLHTPSTPARGMRYLPVIDNGPPADRFYG